MATTKQLQAQLDEMRQLLAAYGIRAPATGADGPGKRPDHITFGSPEHAVSLGLVILGEGEEAEGRMTYASRETGRVYCLEDEVTAFMHFPDPKQVAKLTLRQKVAEFEAGSPPVPANAPPLWQPAFTA